MADIAEEAHVDNVVLLLLLMRRALLATFLLARSLAAELNSKRGGDEAI